MGEFANTHYRNYARKVQNWFCSLHGNTPLPDHRRCPDCEAEELFRLKLHLDKKLRVSQVVQGDRILSIKEVIHTDEGVVVLLDE